MSSDEAFRKVEQWVLEIHRRNGGDLNQIDFDRPLLASELMLDSLDLAEIVVMVEREYHCSPFDSVTPPKTWRDLVTEIDQRKLH